LVRATPIFQKQLSHEEELELRYCRFLVYLNLIGILTL